MIELTGMTCNELTDWIKNQGYSSFRGKQIFKWIHTGADFDEMTNLSKEFRDELKEKAIAQPTSIRMEQKSQMDGTVKFLYETLGIDEFEKLMHDNNRIIEYGETIIHDAINYYQNILDDKKVSLLKNCKNN